MDADHGRSRLQMRFHLLTEACGRSQPKLDDRG